MTELLRAIRRENFYLCFWVVVLGLATAACTGPTRGMQPDELAGLSAPGPGWAQFAAGDTSGACDTFWGAEPSASTLYGRAECARLLGQHTRAAEAYSELLRTAPTSPWASFASTRVPEVWRHSNGPSNLGQLPCETLRTAPDAALWGRYQAASCAMSEAREVWANSDDDAPFDGGAFGFPTQWRVVGPTSIRGSLDFDEETQPERDAALADSYDLLGFQRRTSFLTTRAHLDLDGLSGIYVAETWIELDRERRLDVVLDYPGLALLRIDGEDILRRDDRDRSRPNTLVTRGVTLSAGTHRVTLRVAVDRGYKRYLQLALLGAAGQPLRANPWDRSPKGPPSLGPAYAGGPSGSVVSVGTQGRFFDLAEAALPSDPAVLHALAVHAIAVHDEWLARPAIARLEAVAPTWAALSLIRHDLAATLWTVPSKIRRKDSLRELRAALAGDPTLNLARLQLATALRSQELKDATGKTVTELLAQGGDEAHNWNEAARYYAWRRFPAKTEAAWRRATELDPDDCDAARELYRTLQARDATPGELTPVQDACEGINWLHARDVARLRGDSTGYLGHLRRDVSRYPDQAWRWVHWVRALEVHAPAEVDAALVAALAWHPADVDVASFAADVYASRGDDESARRVLATALGDHSGSASLHRQLALLDGELPLRDLLADGAASIRSYERSEERQELNASAIFVLDYMARRYFEDGTSADVTHLVVKVLAKEGLDEHGEISFPSGSVPLLLRTIKKSGRIIEPQPQRGKSKVSMVGLDVGDYVEYAYLSFSGRIPTQKGAALGANFYFKMSNIASAHSEFVVETPVSWDPLFLAEHGAPVAETAQANGYNRYRFLRTGSVQQRAEPDAVANAEHLPHVQMLHRYGWEDVHRRRQDDLAGVGAVTPLLDAMSREVVEKAGATSRRQVVRALFAHVAETVKSPRMGDFSTPASFVGLTGEGNPIVLLRTLLRVHDIDSAVYVARPLSADPNDTALPQFDKYSFVALRVAVDDGELWLAPVGKYAPFDLLPPEVHGVPAINIEPGASFSREMTPLFDEALGRVEDEVEATLGADGGLVGTYRIVRNGFDGAGRRSSLEQLGTEDKLRKYLERDLNYVISGGEMTQWRIEGREDADKPLVIEIDFRRPGYARAGADGSLLIEDRYALPDLTRRHARLAQRTVPMLLRRRESHVRVKMKVPAGRSVVADALPDLEVLSSFGSYARKVEFKGGVLSLDMRLSMPTQRVMPDEYGEFGGWAGDVDRGTYLRIEVR